MILTIASKTVLSNIDQLAPAVDFGNNRPISCRVYQLFLLDL